MIFHNYHTSLILFVVWLYSITKMISITVPYYVKLSYLVPFIHDENPTGVIFHAVILL